MTDNEILARWQGYTLVYDSSEGVVFTTPNKPKAAWQHISKLPDYLNDEAACMSLLDTLVEKGLLWEMKGCKNEVWFEINKPYSDRLGEWTIAGHWGPTRREAIIAACLEVARKELNHVD